MMESNKLVGINIKESRHRWEDLETEEASKSRQVESALAYLRENGAALAGSEGFASRAKLTKMLALAQLGYP